MSPSRPSPLLLLLAAVGVGVGVGAESANSLSVIEASRLLALDAEIVRGLRAYLEEEEERRQREEVEGDPESHTPEHPWIPAPLASIRRSVGRWSTRLGRGLEM